MIDSTQHPLILCPLKNPKIQESCKKQSDTSYRHQGPTQKRKVEQESTRIQSTIAITLFFGFSNGLSIHIIECRATARDRDTLVLRRSQGRRQIAIGDMDAVLGKSAAFVAGALVCRVCLVFGKKNVVCFPYRLQPIFDL